MSKVSPNTVFFLGAGASKCAGYPLAHELLIEVEKTAAASGLANLQHVWQRWADFRSQNQQALKKGDQLARLLLNPNPEIALSAVDLMDAALQQEDEAAEKEGWERAARDVRAGVKHLEEHFQGRAREILAEARTAGKFLVQALDWYFALKHGESVHQPRTARDYLRDALVGQGVAPGDVIITTNWDTVAELTLVEDGLWTPFDGYGFRRRLVPTQTRAGGSGLPRPTGLPMRSPVRILKLHGSFGWRELNGGIYFDYQMFLQHFPFMHKGGRVVLKDPLEPAVAGINPSLLLYPSFLKRMRTPELHQVWYLAADAVRAAKRVVVIGYSLPEADAAVRTLLLPLRFRTSGRTKCEVLVIDRSDATLRRWHEFLTHVKEQQTDICEALGDDSANSVGRKREGPANNVAKRLRT